MWIASRHKRTPRSGQCMLYHLVPATPPETRFKHHGSLAETREAWAARCAAEATAQARVAQPTHQHVQEAARQAANNPDRRIPSAPVGRRPVRRYQWAAFMAMTVILLLAGLYQSRTTTESVRATPTAQPTRADEPPQFTQPPATSLLSSPYGGAWTTAPAIDPSPDGWWCICYKTSMGRDHTACRRLPSACEELRAMIQARGTDSIQRGSAGGTSCSHIREQYPWTRLGQHGAWTASAHSDAPVDATPEKRAQRRATQAIGICAL